MILNVSHITKAFGEDVLFSDVTFMIEENEKVAFVGPNGCGKTTLFRILTGKEEADGGNVTLASDTSVGYLEQYQDETNADDIHEYVLHARQDILDMEARLKELEAQMGSEASVGEHGDRSMMESLDAESSQGALDEGHGQKSTETSGKESGRNVATASDEDHAQMSTEISDGEAMQMPTASPDGDHAQTMAILCAYHSLLHIYEAAGGNSYRSEVVGVLKGLGFAEEDFHKSMSMLSGGQKTRVNLARLLLTKPDLLLLDEPINHLDLASIEWLEGFLKNYKKTVIIVAHDRYFLDRIVGKVIDLSGKTARTYKGNYTAYAAQKELWQVTVRNAYEKQQEEIAHEEAVIRKLKQFNREKSIKRAESREKKLAKVERVDAPEKEREAMRIALVPDKESGKDVLLAEGLAKAFGEKRLFDGLGFHIQKGERVAIIGDNGCGKTTLLKIINEVLPPDDGTVRIGANVTIGYYDQEQQNLDESKTLFAELSDAYPDLTETKVRNVLAAFLFREDDVYKKIADLSGGERGRISLCKLMLSGANFLILDEPTNHLDMESKDILEQALNSYTGTVLYVSHDRYFVNRTAQRILEMTSAHGLVEYLGNYDYYLEKRENIRLEGAAGNGKGGSGAKTQPGVRDISGSENGRNCIRSGDLSSGISVSSDVSSEGGQPALSSKEAAKEAWQKRKDEAAKEKKRQREIEATEEKIAELEAAIAAIDEQFNDPETAKNSAKLNELTAERERKQAQLDELYDHWEMLSE
ncbi:MAG: ABC-F family ATP-binding cassette domain-containing protein [Lachnospiraceae bacterium]|nr:ABC-F family ATP-binding cassette domain-containing protein [Lachnospiraceae bacterium]